MEVSAAEMVSHYKYASKTLGELGDDTVLKKWWFSSSTRVLLDGDS